MASITQIDSTEVVEIESDDFLVGRNPDAHLVLRDPACSREHFRVKRDTSRFWMEPAATKLAMVNGAAVTERTPLMHGDEITVGNTVLLFQDPDTQSQATQLHGEVEPCPAPNPLVETLALPVGMKVTLGRERTLVTHPFEHIQVSRCHAELFRDASKTTITDLRSSNGTYVNGRRIDRPHSLRVGDKIDIGPFTFEFYGDQLQATVDSIRVDLNCLKLGRCTRQSKTTILKDIQLSIHPGEFVCIIGPSGAGKSTLLRAMSNREDRKSLSATGTVSLNARNLYGEFDRLKKTLAVVPQHEILHENLRLRESLFYTAKLRLPTDTSTTDRQSRIDEVLRQVQLSDRRDTFISQLSGGERKRAALATEILAQPNLLFLDEVTSGLDDLTDSELMRLFRRVADDGKTVVCITHTLACVPRDCDLVVALTRFGRLGFVGSPAETLDYFRVDNLTDTYEKLAVEDEESADRMAQQFLDTSYAEKYVHERLAAWTDKAEASPHEVSLAPLQPRFWNRISQFAILSRRYGRILFANAMENTVRIVQCLLVAGLLCSVFGDLSDNIPHQLQCSFLITLSCYWFGCNNAAKELVKERHVFAQERDVSLGAAEYLASKVLLLTIVSTLQALVLVFLVRYGTHLPGEPSHWAILVAAVAIAGTTAGVAISACSPNEEVAIGFVPIWLIPQIILGDAIVSLQGLNETFAKVSVSLYRGVEATNSILTDDRISWAPLTVLAAHSIIAVGIACWRLKRR